LFIGSVRQTKLAIGPHQLLGARGKYSLSYRIVSYFTVVVISFRTRIV